MRRWCLIVGWCLLALLVEAKPSGTCYRTQRIEKLAQVVGSASSFKGHALCREVSPSGCLQHIGLALFAPSLKQEEDSLMLRFVERYLLELLCDCSRTYPLQRHLREDNVYLPKGDLLTLDSLTLATRFELVQLDELRGQVSWYQGERLLLQMVYPCTYELLWGAPKNEVELGLEAQIRGAMHDSSVVVSGVEDLLPGEQEVEVEQVLYGYQTHRFTMRWQEWIDYCCAQQLELHGYREAEYQQGERVVITATSQALHYFHLLTLTISTQEWGTLAAAQLNAYIPNHNTLER